MVARLVAHLERLHRREHLRAPQREPVRGVVGDGVAALLRFQQQGEGGVAPDIDPLDRIHLHGDIQAHRSPAKHRISVAVQKSASFWRRIRNADF
jgi:hypothetical protein